MKKILKSILILTMILSLFVSCDFFTGNNPVEEIKSVSKDLTELTSGTSIELEVTKNTEVELSGFSLKDGVFFTMGQAKGNGNGNNGNGNGNGNNAIFNRNDGSHLVVPDKNEKANFTPADAGHTGNDKTTIKVQKLQNPDTDFEITAQEYNVLSTTSTNIGPKEEFYYVDVNSPEFAYLNKDEIVVIQSYGLAASKYTIIQSGYQLASTKAVLPFTSEDWQWMDGFAIDFTAIIANPSDKFGIEVTSPIHLTLGGGATNITKNWNVIEIPALGSGKYKVTLSGFTNQNLISYITSQDLMCFETRYLDGTCRDMVIPDVDDVNNTVTYYFKDVDEAFMFNIRLKNAYVDCLGSGLTVKLETASDLEYIDYQDMGPSISNDEPFQIKGITGKNYVTVGLETTVDIETTTVIDNNTNGYPINVWIASQYSSGDCLRNAKIKAGCKGYIIVKNNGKTESDVIAEILQKHKGMGFAPCTHLKWVVINENYGYFECCGPHVSYDMAGTKIETGNVNGCGKIYQMFDDEDVVYEGRYYVVDAQNEKINFPGYGEISFGINGHLMASETEFNDGSWGGNGGVAGGFAYNTPNTNNKGITFRIKEIYNDGKDENKYMIWDLALGYGSTTFTEYKVIYSHSHEWTEKTSADQNGQLTVACSSCGEERSALKKTIPAGGPYTVTTNASIVVYVPGGIYNAACKNGLALVTPELETTMPVYFIAPTDGYTIKCEQPQGQPTKYHFVVQEKK